MDNKNQATFTKFNPAVNSAPDHRPNRRFGQVRSTLLACALLISMALSACSSNSASKPTLAPAATDTLEPTAMPSPTANQMPSPTVAPASTESSQGTAVPTALDPCALISSAEASKLAGASFGKGVEGTTPGGLKMCTYGAQATNIFTVEVVQAASVDEAKADKAQFLSDLQANLAQLTSEGLTPTEIPNFADGAVTAKMSVNTGSMTVNGSAFGFLKGKIFFGFSDIVVGGAAPSDAAMQSEAQAVLGRLP